MGREENARAHQNGRGVPWRQLGFPDHILVRSDLDRQASIRRDTRTVRTAELRPVSTPHEGSAEEEQECKKKPYRHLVNCTSVEIIIAVRAAKLPNRGRSPKACD